MVGVPPGWACRWVVQEAASSSNKNESSKLGHSLGADHGLLKGLSSSTNTSTQQAGSLSSTQGPAGGGLHGHGSSSTQSKGLPTIGGASSTGVRSPACLCSTSCSLAERGRRMAGADA